MTNFRALAATVTLSALWLSQAAACRETPHQVSAEPAVLRVGTAFGPFSLPLADEYRARLSDVEVSTVDAIDSEAVIEGIKAGTIDIGISFADVAYAAHWNEPAQSRGSSLVRGVMLLQPLPQYLLVRGGSGVESIKDLGGRVVVVGPPSTSTWKLGPIILDAFDVKPTVMPVANRTEGAKLLAAGEADAMFLPGYVYPDTVLHSIVEQGGYFIPIDGPAIDALRAKNPFVRQTTIPRDISASQSRVIPTVGIDMVVVCRRDLDPEIVYEMTAALMNAYPQLSGVEANLRFLNPDEAAATPIPLHPGAARYFRERELSR